MNLTVLKIILIVVMALITAFFGLLPIKVIEYIARRGRQSRMPTRSSLILSLLSCFAGGVFLGICFLDLMPDAHEALENVLTDKKWDIDYPIVELIACIGFFLVYLIEESTKRIFYPKPTLHDQTLVTRDNTIWSVDGLEESAEPNQTKTAKPDINETPIAARTGFVRTLTFMVALSFHATFDGFAFGVQDSELSVTALFFGLMVHKSVVAFSVGMRLIRNHPGNRWIVVGLVIFFAILSPLGAAVIMIVENSETDTVTKEMVSTILISLSLGTLIYITFFEILSAERDNEHPSLVKLAATIVGFAVIAGIMTFSS